MLAGDGKLLVGHIDAYYLALGTDELRHKVDVAAGSVFTPRRSSVFATNARLASSSRSIGFAMIRPVASMIDAAPCSSMIARQFSALSNAWQARQRSSIPRRRSRRSRA